jgi:uncharacterized phage protein gp47/JayE
MPDIFNENGLQVKTLQEIRDSLVADMQAIYGDDINLDQDSPDGQMINISSQSGVDIREMIRDAINSLDVDQAEGRVLDQRVALNGITRKAGTFTMTDVSITVDRPLNLQGLDDNLSDINGTGYSVKDDVGNIFILAQSQSISEPGAYSFSFRAQRIGAVQVAPNTITLPETIVAGVTAINNPQGVTQQGTDEESDAQLKTRRRISFALSSVGQLDSLEAALATLDTVTDVLTVENNTAGTVGGIPAHTLWAIIEGGTPADIGYAIYAKRGSGCGTFGAQSVTVPRPNGLTALYYFDRPIYVPLYIQASIGYIGGGTVNLPGLKDYIAENLIYKLRDIATTDTIITMIKNFDKNYYVNSINISTDNTTWSQILSPQTYQQKFTVSTANMNFSEV